MWSNSTVPIICRKCGHKAGYHGMTNCQHSPGSGREPCDCDGWERDPFPEAEVAAR